MTNYVWTAKDKSGQDVVKEIMAQSSAEAMAMLMADGYSDLVLKEDDVMAAAQAGFSEKPKVFGEEIRVTAEDRIKHLDDPIRC